MPIEDRRARVGRLFSEAEERSKDAIGARARRGGSNRSIARELAAELGISEEAARGRVRRWREANASGPCRSCGRLYVLCAAALLRGSACCSGCSHEK